MWAFRGWFVEYLSLTLSERGDVRFAPYCDVPQLPLQPLRDDLSSATYDVFEQDAAKYRLVVSLEVVHIVSSCIGGGVSWVQACGE